MNFQFCVLRRARRPGAPCAHRPEGPSATRIGRGHSTPCRAGLLPNAHAIRGSHAAKSSRSAVSASPILPPPSPAQTKE